MDRRKTVDIMRDTESFNAIFTWHFNKQTLKNIISRGTKISLGEYISKAPQRLVLDLKIRYLHYRLGNRTEKTLNTHADPTRKEGARALVKGIATALANWVGGLENAGNSARTNAKLRSLRAMNCTNTWWGITNGAIPQKGSETGLSHRLLRISQIPKCRG